MAISVRQWQGLKSALMTGSAALILAAQVGCETQGAGQMDLTADRPEGIELGFDQLDSDGDGQLDWNEISEPLERKLEYAGWDQQEVLQRYDHDDDGVLDEDEFGDFSFGLGRQVPANASLGGVDDGESQAEVEGAFAFDDIDADGDGRVGFQEFGDGNWLESEEFSIFDDNEDGAVDQNEFGLADSDSDGFLEEDEFDTFMEELGIAEGS